MPETFDTWMGSQPQWLQSAAADLLASQKSPDEERITKFADLCLLEAAGSKVDFPAFPANAFDPASQGVQVRLKRIESVAGVNALDPTAKLDFAPADLAIVYGHNGTGKSGFAKLTKHAASSRVSSTLLTNVFTAEQPDTSADFVLERDGAETKVSWKATAGPLPEMKQLHVFDADVARFYVTEKAEASYEPRRLRFLTGLVDVCDRVRAELQRRKGNLVSALPAIPVAVKPTQAGTYVANLKPSLTADAVQLRLKRSATHDERVKSIQQALAAPDPATRTAQIDATLTTLKNLAEKVDAIALALADEQASTLLKTASAAQSLRKAAQAFASKTFDQAGLPGVGGEPWRLMWEAARTYSNTVAYPEHTFPYLEGDGLCPLCQQSFSQHARSRIISFEAFVRGEVEAQARAAEHLHQQLLEALPSIPKPDDWAAHFSQIPDCGPATEVFRSAATARVNALAAASGPASVPALDSSTIKTALEARRLTLQNERELLQSAQNEGERAKLEAELAELKALDWCSENLAALLSELNRLKQVAAVDAAAKLTNTAPLTKKKNELAEEELIGGYRNRFEKELVALGAQRLQVAPVEAGKLKGRITFSLAIVGAKKPAQPGQVLSEGEARVVALAAFLADVTVAGARTPFVFDDPVSSLDIEFEERVAERLVALSKTRQVIVFTHRLSLVTLLKEAAKKESTAAKQIESGKAVELKELSLRRLEGRIGLVTETNVLESRVDKALNDLIGRRLAEAKKRAEAGDVESYSAFMKGCCSDLRILTERTIEEELLGGVVLRFRRALVTKDKLTLLAKITVEDCALLDKLMTRLSSFEHSQPPELAAGLPKFDEVLADANALKSWVAAFRARTVPATKS
ncbi:AAA family ATPase [Anaeromyxobacter diazotrophicus]|uniref:Protein CR006 P-loop domain-containing protein n=1 Tax=Anaeromyxobacter diazotrophicus TaxID=2590199 RepID=A0A7I9VQZ7_9BACT|nr:AAA family ATPase [Anaeromyxobacter diazotrophicus]GEJ58843.1 hypothetical protein AMYX_35840 [Anaeromyxobacter diazotrophicus]